MADDLPVKLVLMILFFFDLWVTSASMEYNVTNTNTLPVNRAALRIVFLIEMIHRRFQYFIN